MFFILLVFSGDCFFLRHVFPNVSQVPSMGINTLLVCFLFLFLKWGLNAVAEYMELRNHISMSANDLKRLHSHLGF